MKSNRHLYPILTRLLSYPKDGFRDFVRTTDFRDFVSASDDETSKALGVYRQFVEDSELYKIQELYTNTFDFGAEFSLHGGVHIFGEQGFKRGMFMAKLRGSFQQLEIEMDSELPDYIPLVLEISSQIKDETQFQSMLCECIVLPISLLLKNLTRDHRDNNPYYHLLTWIHAVTIKDLDNVGELVDYQAYISKQNGARAISSKQLPTVAQAM